MAALAAEVAAHHGFPVDNLATPGADADYLRDRNTRGRVYAGVSELRDVDLESPSQVPARQRVSHGVHERPRVRPRGQSTEVFVQAQRQPDRERPTSNAPRTASGRSHLAGDPHQVRDLRAPDLVLARHAVIELLDMQVNTC